MLKNYKPFLLNDMFQLYLQQKYNLNSDQFVYSFNQNYFLNEKEAMNISFDYFESIFEEVHLTKQEDGEYLLELFDLKESVLREFDYSYEKKLLDESFVSIIDFVDQQEVLLNKGLLSGYTKVRKINALEGIHYESDLYLTQVMKKYSFLKGRQGTSTLILSTPYLKWTKGVEEKIVFYFSRYFHEIRFHYNKFEEINFIVAVELGELKEEYTLSTTIDDLLSLIQ